MPSSSYGRNHLLTSVDKVIYPSVSTASAFFPLNRSLITAQLYNSTYNLLSEIYAEDHEEEDPTRIL